MRYSSDGDERAASESMASRDEATQDFRFADCEVRPGSREVIRAGIVQKVERLTFDLIVYLAANSGRVVSKEELLRGVWRNVFVSDSVITQSIMKARRALGDDGRGRAFIATVHRVGYRFQADLHRAESMDERARESASQLVSIARRMHFEGVDQELLVKAAGAMARELARIGLSVQLTDATERGFAAPQVGAFALEH